MRGGSISSCVCYRVSSEFCGGLCFEGHVFAGVPSRVVVNFGGVIGDWRLCGLILSAPNASPSHVAQASGLCWGIVFPTEFLLQIVASICKFLIWKFILVSYDGNGSWIGDLALEICVTFFFVFLLLLPYDVLSPWRIWRCFAIRHPLYSCG